MAFTIKCSLFKATVMYFGFANASTTFQTMMNNIFTDLIYKDMVMIYLDDIFIFRNNIKEHCELVQKVLQ